MRVSYKWLEELVDLNGISREKFLHDLSLYSIEIDEVSPLAYGNNLVVGHVLEKEKHPDADKLSICKVDVGDRVLQIVCGAPNCAANKKVIVALPGAHLPGGEIKESKIRGVESFGMLCSLQELGIENKYVPEEYAHGIYFLDDNAKVGADALKTLCYDDIAIELGLTPNRMDLLSMLGVARDVSAMYNRPLKPLEYNLKEEDKETSEEIEVELETRACYSYYARVIKDVTIKESPQFIKTRLMAAGIRPINNVVDITNYILMLFGQPLHSFDQDALGSKIIVRRAADGEKLVTLDNITRELNKKDIVICDNKEEGGRIVALGGVMGGLDTEVLPTTKNIVLESAVFRPGTIRRTSKRLGLRSESSLRYERGVDLNQSKMALDYACYLMEKYAGGKVLKGAVHQGIDFINDREYQITADYINRYLGLNLTNRDIIKIFDNLGFKTTLVDGIIDVKVPNRRLDISIKADLVEEVARINGYEHLNETLPAQTVRGALTEEQKIRRLMIDTMSVLGSNQVITYSLTSMPITNKFKYLLPKTAEPIELKYPLTEERSVLRMGLVPSLLETVRYNSSRKMKDNHIFELSKVYYKIGDDYYEKFHLAGAFQGVYATSVQNKYTEKYDFYLVKGMLEQIAKRLGLKFEYQLLTKECKELHPTRSAEISLDGEVIGFIGEIHPRYQRDLDLDETYVFELALDKIFAHKKEEIIFKPIPKIPSVERDLALVMDINQPVSDIISAIYSTDKQAITDVVIFDEYMGDKLEAGKKSIAVKITISSEVTLTEEEINQKIKKILKSLEYRYHVTLRA